ncbi:N-acetylmuramoyl-L-alanine amidase, family 3 [gut metagenome]|uniref:N-acetylmuramoyl-L-alanine amidase, family 3 n=1 Tax=gut metagenome TaxID=749906 RepID=J9GE66_9ZZZZ
MNLQNNRFPGKQPSEFLHLWKESHKNQKTCLQKKSFQQKTLNLHLILNMQKNRFYILIWLVCLGAALPFACLQAKERVFVVVIDPGHGGHDPGALGRRGKEKNINLNVALKLGRLIQEQCRDVQVVYTRKTDVFIALDRRAQIANNAKADLFISIHTNSVARNRAIRGTETYTLGLHKTEENLEVAKKENSVILIEDDYKQRYAGFNPNSAESYIIFEFMQDKNLKQSVQLATFIQRQFRNTAQRRDKGVHQAGFLVLRATTMPSVLVELGYISTPDEERYLLSDAGTSALAKSLYEAFLQYKKEHQGASGNRVASTSLVQAIRSEKSNRPASSDIASPTESQTGTIPSQSAAGSTSSSQSARPESKIQSPKASKRSAASSSTLTTARPVFKIQILVSDRKLAPKSRQLKGLTPVNHYREKGLYKYTYGESTDYNRIVRLRRSILPKFKDAFIIAFRNDQKMDVNEAIREYRKHR